MYKKHTYTPNRFIVRVLASSVNICDNNGISISATRLDLKDVNSMCALVSNLRPRINMETYINQSNKQSLTRGSKIAARRLKQLLMRGFIKQYTAQ